MLYDFLELVLDRKGTVVDAHVIVIIKRASPLELDDSLRNLPNFEVGGLVVFIGVGGLVAFLGDDLTDVEAQPNELGSCVGGPNGSQGLHSRNSLRYSLRGLGRLAPGPGWFQLSEFLRAEGRFQV